MMNAEQCIDLKYLEISILGAGRAAKTLAYAWQKKGIHIGQVINQSEASAATAAKFIGAGTAVKEFSPLKKPVQNYRVLVIGLPDSHLVALNDELVKSIQAGQFDLLMHLSGQHGVEVFDDVLTKNIELAAVHPLLPFADPVVALKQLHNSFCLLTASEQASPFLEELFNAIGLSAITAPAKLDRPRYHTSMVVASNLMCAIQYLSIELAKQAGLDVTDAQRLTTSLASNALVSMTQSNPIQALTGPIERGDLDAVDLMLSSLQQLPTAHAEAIQGLLKVVLDMAVAKGSLSEQQHIQVLQHLQLVVGC